MSNDQFDDFETEGEAARPAKKKGMSTGAKVAIVIGIVAGVCLLVCCGVGGWFMNKIGKSMTTEPAEITAIQGTIISEIEVPEGYNPMMGMDLTIAGQGVKMAIYGKGAGQQPEDGAMLMLMQMPAGANEAQMQSQMEQSMGQQQGNITIESSETKAVMIDGSEVKFKFAKGKTQQGNQDVRQVMGVFTGKSGTVMLMHMVPEEEYDEAAVMSMLQSIKK